jgi:hypothetical protein
MADGLELIARRVIATSIAYYGLDVSLVEDTEFDQWCKRLHDEWDDLQEATQWKLGTPEEVRASGYHIKIRQRDLLGTRAWVREKGLLRYGVVSDPKRWLPVPKSILGEGLKSSPQSQTNFMTHRWSTVDNVQWDYKETIQ